MSTAGSARPPTRPRASSSATEATRTDAYGEMLGWWDSAGQMIKDRDGPLARALRGARLRTASPCSIRCFDGNVKTILASAAPLHGLGGKMVGAVVLIRDLTEARRSRLRSRNALPTSSAWAWNWKRAWRGSRLQRGRLMEGKLGGCSAQSSAGGRQRRCGGGDRGVAEARRARGARSARRLRRGRARAAAAAGFRVPRSRPARPRRARRWRASCEPIRSSRARASSR